MARTKKSKQLSMFEGRDVIASKVAIMKAGDGLSQALAIDAQEIALGDKVFIVMEAVCKKVAMDVDLDTDLVTRTHRLDAVTVTMVDEKLVKEVLDAQRLAIEQAKGVERIDFGDPDDTPEV